MEPDDGPEGPEYPAYIKTLRCVRQYWTVNALSIRSRTRKSSIMFKKAFPTVGSSVVRFSVQPSVHCL